MPSGDQHKRVEFSSVTPFDMSSQLTSPVGAKSPVPATPTPNNGVDVSVQHPGPFSTVCELRDEEEYAEVITQIISNPEMSNVPTEYIKRDLLKLFKSGCIACDITLAACEKAILPKVVPLSDKPDWD